MGHRGAALRKTRGSSSSFARLDEWFHAAVESII